MGTRFKLLFSVFSLSLCALAQADVTIQLNAVDDKGVGQPVGQVVVSETLYGLVFSPALSGLAPGLHGFHVHENPACDAREMNGKMVPALAAGGHYDPAASKRHGLPWGDGHLGDLPALYVDANGAANNPVLAPRLKMADIKGRSLMVHAGGDNHSDHPAPLGGGGVRVVCGVIP